MQPYAVSALVWAMFPHDGVDGLFTLPIDKRPVSRCSAIVEFEVLITNSPTDAHNGDVFYSSGSFFGPPVVILIIFSKHPQLRSNGVSSRRLAERGEVTPKP